MQRHFWFSQKQLDGRQKRVDDSHFDSFVVINGTQHQFTESTVEGKPSGTWDDYVLVGVAEESNVTHCAASAI